MTLGQRRINRATFDIISITGVTTGNTFRLSIKQIKTTYAAGTIYLIITSITRRLA
jgi:hypothetical protein